MAIVPIPPASASVAALALPASGAPVMRSMRCCWANDHGGMAGAAEGDAADADEDADDDEEEEEDVDDPGSVASDDKDACRDASEEKVEVAATASGGVARSSARCMSASSAT